MIGINKHFYTELNNLIEDNGYIFGPAQIAFLLYGPIDRKKIRQESLIMLKEREKTIENNYHSHIFPKLHQIVLPLTNGNGKFPEKKIDLENYLQVIPFEEVREKTGNLYWKFCPFEIDRITANNFFSNRKMKQNRSVKWNLDTKLGFIYSTRIKHEKSTSDKYFDRYEKLSDEDKIKFGHFILETCKFSREYWLDEMQIKFYAEFGKDLNRLMINDYFGFKIVEFNQERAEKNLERLAKIGPKKIEVKGFLGVNSRYNDHRKRKLVQEPGGIHFTFVDSGHTNYPIEVQYLDSESFILDQYGPNSHYLYTLRGKKSKEV